MPNGHGGVPFLGFPIALALMFIVFVAAPFSATLGWAWVAICLILAALVGWRLAYDLHMREADEYGGAYTAIDVYRRAARRYRIQAVVYAALTTIIGFAVLYWRGLPQA